MSWIALATFVYVAAVSAGYAITLAILLELVIRRRAP